jgi:cytochrome c553
MAAAIPQFEQGASMNQGKIIRGLMLILALPSAQSALAQTTTPPPAGRLLASNCFQCHGTNGKGGVERLAGESTSEIYKELKEMQGKTREVEMMDMHARGFTDAEIRLLANYFASQR